MADNQGQGQKKDAQFEKEHPRGDHGEFVPKDDKGGNRSGSNR
jgi:hypothetical protein